MRPVKAVGSVIPGEWNEFIGAHTAAKGATHHSVPAEVRHLEEGLDLWRKAQRVGFKGAG
jgi:hypothetical protein